jgi:3,4-dihydroxy 2-butanone 4-phosphate synthase/GTP cyclohydrolase II
MSGPLALSTVEEAVDDIRFGRPVILLKNHAAPGAGGQPEMIVAAAQLTAPATVNALVSIGKGMVYLCLVPERCEALGLRELTREPVSWTSKLMTSIDARDVSGSGISAQDRALTVSTAMRADATPEHLTSPGHVLPLRAEREGTLVRDGLTEGAVDLARLAGLEPAAVMSELLDESGGVADAEWIAGLVEMHRLKVVSIASILAYRRAREPVIHPVASAVLPTPMGDFLATGFLDRVSGTHHVGLTRGDLDGAQPPLVAVEFECRLGRALRGLRCECRARQDDAMRRIVGEGRGVLLHLSRPTGPAALDSILASCSAYRATSDDDWIREHDDPPPWRPDEIAGGMLAELGLSRLRLLTSLSMSDEAFRQRGIEVTERVTSTPG